MTCPNFSCINALFFIVVTNDFMSGKKVTLKKAVLRELIFTIFLFRTYERSQGGESSKGVADQIIQTKAALHAVSSHPLTHLFCTSIIRLACEKPKLEVCGGPLCNIVSSMGYVILSGKMHVERQETHFFTWSMKTNTKHNHLSIVIKL